MEMDMTGLWSWTVPLWGLGALVFFLAAILISPADILTRPVGEAVAAVAYTVADAVVQPGGANQGGGGSRVRKSSNH